MGQLPVGIHDGVPMQTYLLHHGFSASRAHTLLADSPFHARHDEGGEPSEVSEIGTVRRQVPRNRTRVGKVLTPSLFKHRYPRVRIDGKHRYVHLLVAEAFLGPCPDGLEVHHKDDNPGNPTWTNLEYVTRSRNCELAYENGRRLPVRMRGTKSGNAKLNDAKALAIAASKETASVLAARYGVHKSTVQSIRSGRNWSWLTKGETV